MTFAPPASVAGLLPTDERRETKLHARRCAESLTVASRLPPHPGPLPQGEGTPDPALRRVEALWIGEDAASDSPSPQGREGRGEGEATLETPMRLRMADEFNYARSMTPPRLTRVARMPRKHDSRAEKLLWHWRCDRRFAEYKFRRQHPLGPGVFGSYKAPSPLPWPSPSGRGNTASRLATSRGALDWRKHSVRLSLSSGSRGDREETLRKPARLRCEKAAIRDTIWRTLQERAPQPLPDYCRPMSEGKQSSTPGDAPSP
jgi:hypothetical protein